MIKLIFNRFANQEYTQTANLVIKPTLDTSDIKRNKDDVANIKKSLQSLSDISININTSTITNSIKQLENLKKVLSNLHNKRSVNITSTLSNLSSSGAINALPESVKKTLGTLEGMQSATKDKDTYASLKSSLTGLINDLKKISPETDKIKDKVKNIETDVNKTDDDIKNVGTDFRQIDSNAKNFGDTIKDVANNIRSMPSLVQQLSDAFKGLDIVRMVYLYRTVKRTVSTLIDAVDNAAAYEESLNLYSMAFGKYTERAKAWAEEITDKLMLDPSTLMQYAGAFFNLTKGMGVTSEHAYIMSRNLTQLTYDMASYLNISNEAAQAKIQSAMAGQSRAVASVGVATQMASLQELAYSLNIKKSVSEMTQAEKTYLRYIQLMNSTKQMQGDLGKTMITPANAIRALKNQINLLSRAIGQVLTPIIMEALPYLMALTNVLTRAAQSLGAALGYQITDVDFSTTIEDAADALDDYGKSSKKASKSVSESLAPFDELNNVISHNAKAGSGSGSGGGLIDSSIWDTALPQYDMLSKYVDTLKSKAKDLEGTVEKIIGWVTGFLALGVSAKILIGAAKVINAVKTIWDVLKNINLTFDTMLKNMGMLGGIVSLVGGSLVLNSSYDSWYDAATSALESGKDEPQPNEYFELGKGAVKAAAGGAAMGAGVGAIFGGIGAGPGAIIGAIVGEVSYVLSLWSETGHAVDVYNQKLEVGYYALKNYNKSLSDWNTNIATGRSGIFEQLNAELGRIDQYDKWADRLKEIVDSTGKVKEGYEGEAAVIVDQLNAGLGMNIKLQDNQIKNYDKISKEIDKVIEKKKAEAVINHYADAYAKALMDEKDAIKQVHTASDKLKKANEKLKKAKEEGYDPTVIQQMEDEVKNLQTEYDNANDHYYETMKMKETYDEAYVAFAKGNYDEVIKIYQNSGDKQYYYTAKALMDMTKELNGGALSQDLIFAWQKLGEDSKEDFDKALSEMCDEDTRKLILKSIEMLKEPAGLLADDTGELYGSNLVYSVQDYLNDPNHSLKPKVVLPAKTPADLIKPLQDYANNHGINIDINADTSPKEILNAFVKYFAKNPLKLMTEFSSGKLNGILGLLKIAKFANGGFPTSGDLFFANENGRAEYITSVGNQTAVANQGQMVQVLTNAITAGFNRIQGGTNSNVVVYVGDKKLYEGQGEYQSRQNDRYGTTVVRI